MPEEVSLENPLVAIGDEDIVLGFVALGFKTYSHQESEELKTTLEEMIKNKIAICLIQDNIYSAAEELIESYRNLSLPIFIPFSKSAKTDLLDEIIKAIRLRATGAF